MSTRADERILEALSALLARVTALSERHPVPVDVLLAAATLLVSLAGLHVQHRLGPLSVAFGVAIVAPLPLRRRHPLGAFSVIALVALLQWLLDVPQLADASVLFGLYWVARESRAAGLLAAVLVTEAGAIMAAVRWSASDPLKVCVGLSGLVLAAALLGISVRQRRALLDSLQDRAARLELERDQEGRLGAAAERARIAREMHDIVSHNLTVMIALADAAGYSMDNTPEQAVTAIERVARTGRQALGEMRRLLGVLRSEPTSEPLQPQPSLAGLGDLLGRVQAAGLPVRLELEGDPQVLDEGVQLAVYRIVQEALTNTLKHAQAPAGALVRLACPPSGPLRLEVTDDGGAVSSFDGGLQAAEGRGLQGMRERATAYGGRVTVGPRQEGGWRVQLTIAAREDG